MRAPLHGESYQLTDMHTVPRPDSDSSVDHGAAHARDGRRIAGEEYADDDVDAFIAENERFQHGDGGEFPGWTSTTRSLTHLASQTRPDIRAHASSLHSSSSES